uniref:UvrD-helicase domain-containing protein n=1 Tax=Succinivibrio sp. TaxID=2053619 RepID=UPI00402AC0F4
MENKNLNKPDPLEIKTFDLNSSSMIEASAGTGKTFTISNLVVRLLLEGLKKGKGENATPLDIEDILVVTFTNAAASDLRARILEKIHTCRVLFEAIGKGQKTVDSLDENDPLKDIVELYLKDKLKVKDSLENNNAVDINIQQKQAILYSRLLIRAERSIDKASISTIHSFCNKALNQIYSFEAGRAFNVELTNDVEEEKREAAFSVWRDLFYKDSDFNKDLLLELLGKDSPLSLKKTVEKLSRVRLINDAKGYFGFSLKSYYQSSEKLQKTPIARLKYLLDAVEKDIASINEEHAQDLQIVEKYKDEVFEANGGPGSLYKLDKGDYSRGGLVSNVKIILKSLLANTASAKFNSVNFGEEISKNVKKDYDFKDFYNEDCNFVRGTKGYVFARSGEISEFEKAARSVIILARDMRANIDLIKKELDCLVSVMMIKKTDALCERDNLISNNEVLRQLAVALTKKDRGDVLASLLRKRYPIAMIDEFQDTDPVQFTVFSKLYLNQDAVNSNAHCYLIGDPKQSIYKFRGSDINSYNEAKSQIEEIGGCVYTLETNYRSNANVVKAVNEIFAQVKEGCDSNYVAKPFDYNDSYSEKTPSNIKFDPVIASPNSEKSSFYFDIPIEDNLVASDENLSDTSENNTSVCNFVRKIEFNDKTKAEVLMQAISKSVALEVKRCLLYGKINSKGNVRAVKPSDIAILVSNKNENKAIQDALKELSIQSVYFSDDESVLSSSSQSKSYSNSSDDTKKASVEAENIIYLMEAICNSTNASKVYRLLGSSLLSLTREEFIQKTDSFEFDDEISLLRECGNKWESYGFITAFLYYLNKHDLLKTMLNAENGERALSNYFQIAEIIQSINSKVIGSNAQLLWFKDLVLNGNSDLSDDVTKKHLESEQSLVKIYTIHKSKGLQYPIVFSPFLFGTTNYDKDGIYYDPHDRHVSLSLNPSEPVNGTAISELEKVASLQEKVRLLYVDLTRAQLANFVFLPIYNDEKKTNAVSALRSITIPKEGELLKALDSEELFTNLNKFDNESDPDNEKLIAAKVKVESQCSEKIDEPSSLDKGSVDNSFTVTSYSAITSGAHNDMFASDIDEKEIEPDANDLEEDISNEERNLINFTFSRGSAAGSFLHKLLEIVLSRNDVNKEDQDSIYQFVNSQLKYDYYHLISNQGNEKICALASWLNNILNANLLPESSKNDHLKLSDLTPDNCARELDYYLPCKDFKVKVLNKLCHEFYAKVVKDNNLSHIPDLPDLKKSNFKGFMKGSLDLVAKFTTKQGDKFFMIDYKSNYLGDSFGDYTQDSILKSIFEARYDVQILFYSLALYRFLKCTLHDFLYEKDFGGVMYLYLRGMNSNNTVSPGQFYVRPSEELIKRLSDLFDGIEDNNHE